MPRVPSQYGDSGAACAVAAHRLVFGHLKGQQLLPTPPLNAYHRIQSGLLAGFFDILIELLL
jgi:hypothetical protein